MGEVYRAHDPLIDRTVAIKVIRRELIEGSGSAQWLERFKREARVAGQRFHPNIVTVLDYGEGDGLPFLAMEFVDGPSLASLLRAGPLPPARAVAIIHQVLSGLAFAHDSGLIHRDIKPSNILVPATGPVKIADFGIARTDTSDLTVVGDILGTPAYVAPEQLYGDPIDNRSDLFAVGVMLFETLSGVKPFRAKTLAESIALMKNRGPEDICALNPLVPIQLKRVIDQALAFDPALRFVSALEFSRAIAVAAALDPAKTGGAPTPAPPLPLTVPSPPDRSIWDAELLHRLEQELAVLIGPLAAFAVKRAAQATSDLGALYAALAPYIDNEQDRRQFLQTEWRLALRMPDRNSSASGIQATAGARPVAGDASALPPLAVVAEIETSLTRIVGPIAKTLIQRHLQKYATLPQFYQSLAADIPDERDRAAFLDALRSG